MMKLTPVLFVLLATCLPRFIFADATTQPFTPPVMCGIDVLEQQNFTPLRGKHVALVTNQTGLDAQGRRNVDVLAKAPGMQLTELMSPEHGLYGRMDSAVGDTVDPTTGLKVVSLYGKDRKPSAEMLHDADTIVYDIQDVGARYYTYSATLGLCMEAAAAQKIPIFVLDRPNPVTGQIVDGPLADNNLLGFTAYAPVPVSYGMTPGELAGYYNQERNLHCDLHVIQMTGWRRSMWWDDTGRLWINPSPAMRNPTQALLYLGVGLLEGTNVSVGRGTDQPFELFGAPWIDGPRLAGALNASHIPGLRFVAVAFTPNSSICSGEACQGCYVEVVDRTAVQPVPAGLTIAWTLQHLFGSAFHIDGVGRLLRNAKALTALKEAKDPSELAGGWQDSLNQFKQVRAKYLLYP